MAKTAWLLGAGFSYELGMPLVWDLTRELKEWLTPAKLREMVAVWQARGNAVPSHVVAAFEQRLVLPDEHYEGLVAWLQAEQFRLRTTDAKHYESLVGMLQDVVGEILRARHVRNPEYHRQSLPWFRGLASAVPEDAPLWVFSLNHDVHIELLGIELGIPVAAGFPDERAVGFTRPDGRRMWFDRVTRTTLARHELNYPTTRAINLVKLHGALDVFAYKDLGEFLRVHPDENTTQSWLTALAQVEDLGTRISGEVCVDDDDGVMQFLRRTVVTGGFKFDPRAQYNAPSEVIEFFARKLADFDELVVIGYSWCDRHINDPIEAWLAGAAHRRVINVDPFGLNHRAAHIAARVDDRKVSTAEFLASFNPSPIDATTAQQRELRLEVLRVGKTRAQEALERVMQSRVRDVVDWAARQVSAGDVTDQDALLARFAAERRFDAIADFLKELRAVR